MRKNLSAIALSLVLLMLCTSVAAGPVDVRVSRRQLSATEIEVVFTAAIAPGWHIYAPDCPPGGPNPATLTTEKAVGAKAVGGLKASGNARSLFDPVFGMQVKYFEGQAVFTQRYRISSPAYAVKGYLEYSACDERSCMPPTTVDFELKPDHKQAPASAPSPTAAAKKESGKAKDTTLHNPPSLGEGKGVGSPSSGMGSVVGTNTPASIDSLPNPPSPGEGSGVGTPSSGMGLGVGTPSSEQGLGVGITSTFLMGFLGGLVALLTPCVWPVIPMTVSFFLRRSKDKRGRAIRDAATYGAAIIVIYMALALLFTALFGPEKLNAMATNAPLNIVFTLLLVVFAMSLMGWFELSLPASWANKVDSKATTTGGVLSIFLMAFTLAIVSFSCTCPIVGLLLVDFATSGQWIAPVVGMFGFALALALPFTLFALFPSWLKKAPKSGAWMNQLKVTLAFIELAFACKFFSVADLAYGWQLMSRDAFLAIWITLFGALGLYLMGLFNFQSDGDEPKARPVLSIMGGMVSLAFAIYMVPGLWGAPCKAVSAFAPPMTTQQFSLTKHQQVTARYTSYDEARAAAAAQGKPLLIDFTGYGCVNCRKMEASVWTDDEVASLLTDDYVLVSLYVDDRKKLDKPITVTGSDGKTTTLRTVGDRWSHLQQTRFGQLTQPLYVAITPDGQLLAKPMGFTESAQGFADWLRKGLKAYRTSTANNQQP
ncbi:MAG: thioredoxin family protein [Prevotella sp.]|nr:thioredoxin family protein [Prevotella sp.]